MKFDLQQLKDLASSAGFQGDAVNVAAAVAMAESGGDSAAVGDPQYGFSIGLWQVNLPSHKNYTREWLLDAQNNASAAYAISSGGKNWRPWTTYRTGAYLRWMPGGAPPANPPAGPPASQWEAIPAPVPAFVATEAARLLGVLQLGESVVQRGPDGRTYKYVCETHPPDAGIATPHKGISVVRRKAEKPGVASASSSSTFAPWLLVGLGALGAWVLLRKH